MTEPETFNVIYADPPWRYDFSKSDSRQIENNYPTMTQDEICAVPVPAAPNAVLFLWGVAPKLPEALQVMASWGFEYRSGAVWDKEVAGMGYWFRGQHEHLLVGVKGRWSPPDPPLRASSVFREQRGRHSKKPEGIRNMIATWWPTATRLEDVLPLPRSRLARLGAIRSTRPSRTCPQAGSTRRQPSRSQGRSTSSAVRLDTLTCADATWCQSRKRSPRSPDLTPVGPGFVLCGGARLHGVATRRRDSESNWENPRGHRPWLVTGRRTVQGEAA